ncbi:MAG TPA: PAS domain S-box protein, partial [Chloroflexota bacterium]
MGGGGDGRFAEVWSDRQRGREGERSGRQGVTTAPVLLDQLPVVVYAAALDEANTTLYLSPWSETILGLRPEEWVGLPHLLPDLVHPGDYQRVAAELRAAQARCEPFRCEYRVVRRDGRLVWVRDEASIARQPDGQPLFLQGVMVDVTDGKQAEQDLQESEQRYRRLVEMSPDAIAVHCDGRFVYINPAGMRLLGASRPEEVVGKSIYEIVHPDYHAVVEERVRQQLHELRPAPLIHERYRRLDGTVVDVEVASTPVVYRGRPAIQVVARDITHRKRVEERLHEHARQQAAVASLGRQALAGLDLNRLMDEAVRRVVETLGVPFGCVFELRRSENVLLVRAGVGWGDDVVGRAVVGVGRGSHAGYTLLCQAPVVVEDWRSERRFHVPWLVRAHGVVSGVCVVIHGRDHPFGVLAVGTRERRRFREEEVHFLQAVANLLGEAVERARAEQALREREERFRLLAENAQDMVFRYELKPKRGYSYVNPAATRITGYTPEEYYADPFI